MRYVKCSSKSLDGNSFFISDLLSPLPYWNIYLLNNILPSNCFFFHSFQSFFVLNFSKKITHLSKLLLLFSRLLNRIINRKTKNSIFLCLNHNSFIYEQNDREEGIFEGSKHSEYLRQFAWRGKEGKNGKIRKDNSTRFLIRHSREHVHNRGGYK